MEVWKSDILAAESGGSGRDLESRREFNRELLRMRGGGRGDNFSVFIFQHGGEVLVMPRENETGKVHPENDRSRKFDESRIVLREIAGKDGQFEVEAFGPLTSMVGQTTTVQWNYGDIRKSNIQILPARDSEKVFGSCTIL